MNQQALPRWLRVIALFISLLMIIALLFSCLRQLLVHSDVFEDEYRALDHAKNMGMSLEELVLASEQMVAYMEGSTPGIDIEVTVYGERVGMFNERERAHMVDVKILYQNWRTAAWIFWGLYGALCLYVLLRYKSKGLFALARTYRKAGLLFTVILSLLGVWIHFDFNSFWTAFHHLFFTNDLWQLDPLSSRMINMMPLELFFGIVLRMAGRFVIWFVSLFALSYVLSLIEKRGKYHA